MNTNDATITGLTSAHTPAAPSPTRRPTPPLTGVDLIRHSAQSVPAPAVTGLLAPAWSPAL